MAQTASYPPDSVAIQTLADAVEAEGLSRVFDGADAIVRSAIKARRLRLARDTTLDAYVLDVVTEALADAYKKAEVFDAERGLTPWLIGFAKGVVKQRIRDRARQNERDADPTRSDVRLVRDEIQLEGQPNAADDDLFGVLESYDPESAVDARLDIERVLAALEDSSGDGAPNPKNAAHADILRRYYLEGATTKELAEDYGISENGVDARRSRARKAARKVFGIA